LTDKLDSQRAALLMPPLFFVLKTGINLNASVKMFRRQTKNPKFMELGVSIFECR